MYLVTSSDLLWRVCVSSGNLRRYSSSPATSPTREIGAVANSVSVVAWDNVRKSAARNRNESGAIIVVVTVLLYVFHAA